MPTINIREEYATTTPFLATDHVVYIPGFTNKTLDGIEIGVPTLFTSVLEFENKIGTGAKLVDTKEDLSFLLAHELLRLGVHVLYEVPKKSTGVAVATVQEFKDALNAEGFWSRLSDKGKYNIRFITAGGYLDTDLVGGGEGEVGELSNMIVRMIALVKERGDAVALIDHNKDFTTETQVEEFFDEVSSIEGTGPEYATGLTPHIPVRFEASVSTTPIIVPGSFGYLLGFAQSVQTNPSWFSVAGAKRGKIPGLAITNIAKPSITYGENDANALQGKEVGSVSVNPIVDIKPYGVLIWGNRTLKKVGPNGLDAKNFLNIRNLISSIRKTLFVASRGQTFEQNDDILWINFKAAITPLLEQMKTGSGIADYKLFKKASTKRATLTAVIRIAPIEAVEDFNLTIDLRDSVDSINE